MRPCIDELPMRIAERRIDCSDALEPLRWRCRRGLLENDLILERFFDAHERR